MVHNAPHILVVDDNKEIRDLLAKYLDQNGLSVSVASSGTEMRNALRRNTINLIVLDIMMPGEDGLSLCKAIRQTSDLPIVLLTAMAEEADRIIGLELGADDYVTKPFNPRELLARIKAVLRRAGGHLRLGAGQKAKLYRFENFTLDMQKRELQRDDVLIELGSAEMNLLLVFLRRPNVVLSRDQLLDVTAGRKLGAFDRSIDNLITRLRKSIEVDAKNPSLIKTVWGQGYTFAGEVETL